jgi:hypothetical protein
VLLLVLCFIRKSRGAPREREAIVGLGPRKLGLSKLDGKVDGMGWEGGTNASSSLCQLIESFPSA